MEPNTVQLVEQARQGDDAAFAALYEEGKNNVYYLGCQMLGNMADAEDLVQEVFLSVHQNLHTLQKPEAFWGWLKQIAANRCKNRLMKKRPALFAGEEDEDAQNWQEDPSEDNLPESAAEQAHVASEVMRLIRALPPDQRMVVLLFYYQQMKTGEIATALGISEGTVKSRLNYARRHLKVSLEAEAKQDNKLYSLSAPLLLLLLNRDAATYSTGLSAGSILSAGKAAKGPQPPAQGGAATAAAGGKAGVPLAVKLVAAAVVLAVGAGIGVAAVVNRGEESASSAPSAASAVDAPASVTESAPQEAEPPFPLWGADLREVEQALAGNWASEMVLYPQEDQYGRQLYLSFAEVQNASSLYVGYTGYAQGSGILARSSLQAIEWRDDGRLVLQVGLWSTEPNTPPQTETLLLDVSGLEDDVIILAETSLEGLQAGPYTRVNQPVNGPLDQEAEAAFITSLQGVWRQEEYYTNPDPALSFSQGYPTMLAGKDGNPRHFVFGLASETATAARGGVVKEILWRYGGVYHVILDASLPGTVITESFYIDVSDIDEGVVELLDYAGVDLFAGAYIHANEQA